MQDALVAPEQASALVLAELDSEFFAARLERSTETERKYLYSLARLGNGPQSSTEAAEGAGFSISRASPIRKSLIDKGIIYSPGKGLIEFTVPRFSDYLLRISNGN